MSFPFYSLSVQQLNNTKTIAIGNSVTAPTKPALADDGPFVLPIVIPRLALPKPRSDGMLALQFFGVGFDADSGANRATFLRFDFYDGFPGTPPLGTPGLWTDYLDFALTPTDTPWSSGRQYISMIAVSNLGLALYSYASFQDTGAPGINPGMRNFSLTLWGADENDDLPPLIPPTPEP